MSVAIKEYSSLKEFLDELEETAKQLRSLLGEYLRKLDDLRVKAESQRKLLEFIGKLAGKPISQLGGGADIKISNMRILVNPTADQELSIVEELVEKLNESLSRVETVKKELMPFADAVAEAKITAIYSEGLPKTIVIKF